MTKKKTENDDDFERACRTFNRVFNCFLVVLAVFAAVAVLAVVEILTK